MISPNEATEKIEQLMPNRSICRLSLSQCINKIIAQDIYADSDIPPFSRSSFDGYAFRSSDTVDATENCPVELSVVETIPAGQTAIGLGENELKQSAVKVMTGSVIPYDYDAVLPWEQVFCPDYQDKVLISQKIDSGHNIIPQGEDISKGELVIKCGEQLTPHHIGILSSLGVTTPLVYQPYKIGVIVTGNELIPPEQELVQGKIRSSNNYTLGASLNNLGQTVVDFGIVTDDEKLLTERIVKACEQVDILLTTGGVSKGDYDFVPYVLENMGAHRLFWRVNMKPGTPGHVAQYKGTPVISLSGNPAACMTTFHLLLVPALLTKTCAKDIQENIHSNKECNDRILDKSFPTFLAQEIKKKKTSMWRFLRGRSWIGEDGRYYCKPIAKEKSSMLKTMMWENGYIVIPPDSNDVTTGDRVQFIPIDK